MTQAQKVQYARIALALIGIPADDMHAEMVITTIEHLQKKGGDFNLRDAAGITAKITEKYKRLAKKSSKKE